MTSPDFEEFLVKLENQKIELNEEPEDMEGEVVSGPKLTTEQERIVSFLLEAAERARQGLTTNLVLVEVGEELHEARFVLGSNAILGTKTIGLTHLIQTQLGDFIMASLNEE